MAVFGGVLLIIILLCVVWIILMSKFEKIGDKVSGKFMKTFSDNEEEEGK